MQLSHPSGHLVIAEVSMKYFGEATKHSANVLPKHTEQLEVHGEIFEIVVVLDKVTVDG